jgi:hypothetical protein
MLQQRVTYQIGLVTSLFPVQNALLQFEKVVKVKKQVVAGTLYYLTIEVKDGNTKKLYEAKVWEKPWENFKELQEFKPAEDGASA